jgi:hypothetical protein
MFKVRVPASALMTSLGLTLLSGSALAQTPDTRLKMERCVDGVLARMIRAKAPESQVAGAVLSHCDAPLRETLASAIRTGSAFMCSVESCIGLARNRAAEKAIASYRERQARN